MAGNFYQASTSAKKQYEKFLKPALEQIYTNSIFYSLECAENVILASFDKYAGFDCLSRNKISGLMRAFALRIQEKLSYDTFTVRNSRDSGAMTEYEKRIKAMEVGALYPTITVQAYIVNDRLSAFAIVRTVDLFEYIKQHHPPIKKTNPLECGQSSFYVVKWDDLINAKYDVVVVKPIADSAKRYKAIGKNLNKEIFL